MVNPRKPKRRKEIEGTYRADRDPGEPDLPPAADLDAPDTLNGTDAVELWNHIVEVLGPAQVLSDADLPALLHLCNLHARCVRLWHAGESPKAAELTQLRLYFSEFGMTPASRAKTSPVEKSTRDPADEFFDGPQLVDGADPELSAPTPRPRSSGRMTRQERQRLHAFVRERIQADPDAAGIDIYHAAQEALDIPIARSSFYHTYWPSDEERDAIAEDGS